MFLKGRKQLPEIRADKIMKIFIFAGKFDPYGQENHKSTERNFLLSNIWMIR